MTDIPQWVWGEIDRRAGDPTPKTTMGWAAHCDRLRCLAAELIAEHEQPPVDPLLIEARELAASERARAAIGQFTESEYRAGLADDTPIINLTLTALKRGIEIERERAK